MTSLHVSSTPHIHQRGSSTQRIMLDVLIALVPAAAAGVVIFGVGALWTIVTCVAAAMLSEVLFNLCAHKKQTVGDLSAAVTGLLLALNLSTNVPLWQCALGSVFAMVIVKGCFGGIGKNIVNPAIAARVFLLLAFAGTVAGGALPVLSGGDIASGATPLVVINQGAEAAQSLTISQLFLGNYGGAIGETCTIALLAGYVYLVARKVIKWYVPVSFAATVFVLAFCFGGFDAGYALMHVLSGGLLLGAIFMATDYVTTPNTGAGRVIFCIGAGALTYLIRRFGGYPEGVSIAILTMNLLTPFIGDLTKRKTLGGVK